MNFAKLRFPRDLSVALALLLPVSALFAESAPDTQVKRVMVVIFENAKFKKVKELPFFKRLSKEGTSFINFYAVSRPSQPNYFALTAASDLNVRNNFKVTKNVRHIGNLIEEKGKSWKAYVEDWPGDCYLGSGKGNYRRKHNPFISFKNVQDSPERCDRIVEAGELERDIREQTLPDYSFYVPNIRNNGHDTGSAYADGWYGYAFSRLLVDPKFRDGLLLISTFDESNLTGNNHIYTSFWGPGVKQGGEVSTRYDLYDLIRTVEDVLGLDTLGKQDVHGKVMKGWQAN